MIRYFGILPLLLLLLPTPQKITSQKIGDWANAQTWDCNCIPTGQDTVVVAHDSITISTEVSCHYLKSETGGKLHFTPTGKLAFE
ncbi:hypothetical protein VB796_06485 [Arcicella sp. LKC2W]|uniref:hypothetical protein n=1 Tax=Arcicella sp. LKC2W TaxID=2984198 RepID=UPI002B1EC241|nr:hypothetical protein [Arcicella sp. LKC2W]MEA5458674.1 hypothetical protein [Arcicella sp. LKC2W]